MDARIRLAAIGCGPRARVYTSIAAGMPDRYSVAAAADPVQLRVEKIRNISKNPDFKGFASDKDILSQDKLADVMIIATQDNYHYEPCIAAMKKGYDIILEKPAADTVEKVIEIEQTAKKCGRSVTVCYVLRYTPFYKKVKQIIDSGELGEIVSISATEGVEPWHQSHSFVRGHWAVTENCTPMIVAKSCHDIDIIHWLTGKRFANIASFGGQSYFNPQNAPEGSPQRCTDGCQHSGKCLYDARRYAGDKRGWLELILPGAEQMTNPEVCKWLESSNWGRCVFKCGNTTVDHQVLGFGFDDGTSGTFTMTAFDYGRRINIYGTKASLYGWAINKLSSDADILLHHHLDNRTERINITASPEEGYNHHGGGDHGLIKDFYDDYTANNGKCLSAISSAVHSHIAGFAAQEAMVSGQVVNIAQYYNKHKP